MKRGLILAGIGIVMLVANVLASDWEYLGSGWEVEVESIETTDSTVKAWWRTAVTANDVPGASYQLGLLTFDCAERRIICHKLVTYNARGSILDQYDKTWSYDNLVPDSRGEYIVNLVCGMLEDVKRKSRENTAKKGLNF